MRSTIFLSTIVIAQTIRPDMEISNSLLAMITIGLINAFIGDIFDISTKRIR